MAPTLPLLEAVPAAELDAEPAGQTLDTRKSRILELQRPRRIGPAPAALAAAAVLALATWMLGGAAPTGHAIAVAPAAQPARVAPTPAAPPPRAVTPARPGDGAIDVRALPDADPPPAIEVGDLPDARPGTPAASPSPRAERPSAEAPRAASPTPRAERPARDEGTDVPAGKHRANPYR
jgi:hypothetical protein